MILGVPIALRMAKTPWSFGHSECNRVKFFSVHTDFDKKKISLTLHSAIGLSSSLGLAQEGRSLSEGESRWFEGDSRWSENECRWFESSTISTGFSSMCSTWYIVEGEGC